MAKHVYIKAAHAAPFLAISNVLTYCVVKYQRPKISCLAIALKIFSLFLPNIFVNPNIFSQM